MSAPIRCIAGHDGRSETILLARPKANIVDREMVEAIRARVRELQAKPELRLLIFEGEGAHFSFGASIEEHLPDRIAPVLGAFHAMFREIEALAVPTAALVRGQCLGGGFELATYCGRVIADPSARLAVPEIKLAVFPPVAAAILAWRVGGNRATNWIVTGETIEPDTALASGLIDAIAADPRQAIDEWFATHIAPKSAAALRQAWTAARRPLRHALEVELASIEKQYLEELMQHPDAVEGIRAFIEKRPPRWKV